MHWLEALECYLNEFIRPFPRRKPVVGAIVESIAPPPTQVLGEVIGGWRVEERTTTCGNIALHLFPSGV